MKSHAEAALKWGKEVYRRAHANSNSSEVAEALSVGVDQSTTHNYLDEDSPRNLPFGLVPNSRYAKELTEALCEKMGGVYIHLTGHPNGETSDELKAIIRFCGDLVKESDPQKRLSLFKKIEVRAAEAVREEAAK